MNGVDPAPQDVALQDSFFSGRKVKAFVYNQQVADSLTQSFLSAARRYGIPVVGVYETMPAHYDYRRGCSPKSRHYSAPSPTRPRRRSCGGVLNGEAATTGQQLTTTGQQLAPDQR